MTATIIDFEQAVADALDADDRDPMWLARRSGIAYHNVRRGCLHRRRFTADEIAAIRAVLPHLPLSDQNENGG